MHSRPAAGQVDDVLVLLGDRLRAHLAALAGARAAGRVALIRRSTASGVAGPVRHAPTAAGHGEGDDAVAVTSSGSGSRCRSVAVEARARPVPDVVVRRARRAAQHRVPGRAAEPALQRAAGQARPQHRAQRSR